MGNSDNHILGIIGGLGPASTAYFYQMIIEHTKANRDSDHIDLYISNAATTPDRTAFILDNKNQSPLPRLQEEAKKLKECGCDVLALSCNTAHCFFDEIKNSVGIEMLNMVDLTFRYLDKKSIKKVGILATDGTIETGLYQNVGKKYGIECVIPDKDMQKKVMSLIYDYIKGGRSVSGDAILSVYNHLRDNGAEFAVLACTELSILKKKLNLSDFYIDALEILAKEAIEYCNKEAIGFEELK